MQLYKTACYAARLETEWSRLDGAVEALHKQQLWKESIPPMLDYLRQYPDPNARLRLTLAEILLDANLGPRKC